MRESAGTVFYDKTTWEKKVRKIAWEIEDEDLRYRITYPVLKKAYSYQFVKGSSAIMLYHKKCFDDTGVAMSSQTHRLYIIFFSGLPSFVLHINFSYNLFCSSVYHYVYIHIFIYV